MFWRDFALLILLSIGVAIAGVFSTWWVWNNQNTTDELQDVLFELLPDLSDIKYPIPNYIIFAQYAVSFISFPPATLLKRIAQFVFLINVLTLTRAVTVTLTLLPNIHVYDYCNERPDSFLSTLSLMIEHGTCADYMFSGHTASSFLMYMFVHRHTYHIVFDILSLLCSIAIMIVLILQRWHYSIDIVFAVLLVWFVFNYYKRYEIYRYWGKSWFYFRSFEWEKVKKICHTDKYIGRQSRIIEEEINGENRIKRFSL